jgi:hypothetical protein
MKAVIGSAFEEGREVRVDDLRLCRRHPIGNPLYVFRVPFFNSLAKGGAESA